MKISVALFILSLLELYATEISNHQAEKANSSEGSSLEPSCSCAADATGNQRSYCELLVIIKELEAKLKNTEKQLADLASKIQGKKCIFRVRGSDCILNVYYNHYYYRGPSTEGVNFQMFIIIVIIIIIVMKTHKILHTH